PAPRATWCSTSTTSARPRAACPTIARWCSSARATRWATGGSARSCPGAARVHAPWTIALRAWLRERGELELESIWSDDGIVLRMPERERPPAAEELLPDPAALRDLVVRELPAHSIYA